MKKPARYWSILTLLVACQAGGIWAQRPEAASAAAPAVSPDDPIVRIRDEGLNRSEVMATLLALTDLNGPRLTGSPGLRQASEWSRDRFTAWGLRDSRLEPWGPFGRGWSLRRFSAQAITPVAMPLIAFPKAWSPGLGPTPLEAEVVHVDIKKAEDFERYRGRLKGKVVLDGPIQEMKMRFEPLALRRTDSNLLALANAGPGTSGMTRPTGPSPLASPEQRAALALLPRRYQFFTEEGVAVLLQPSRLGEAGNLFASQVTVYPSREPAAEKSAGGAKSETGVSGPPLRNVSPWKTDCPPIIPQVTVATEQYNRLVRVAQQGSPLKVALELQADYHHDDLMSANVLAEIPGTDRAGEIVMLGAHLDSWHSGTGATDNAAGCSVVMEVVRILRALDLKPRRTIRVALWSGEEQGLLGSKAYVVQQFGTSAALAATAAFSRENPASPPAAGGAAGIVEKKPAYDSLYAYFNLDNGGGKIRGVYLQGNEAARPIFRDWLKSFKDLGVETISLANTSGTDHLSFDAIGLPGFQFIQDELEYNTRTHHGNADVFDRVVAEDLKQAAVVMAAVVYQAAMHDGKFPRKPSAPATPSGREGRGTGKGKKS